MKKMSGIVFIILIIAACKKIVNSPAITAPNSYLVVNGNITVGDTTVINLSRTVSVTDSAKFIPVSNAVVTVEGSDGTKYPLVSKNNGNYISARLNILSSATYRLTIQTSDGKQYASDFVPVKNSPAIDSVTYAVKSDGVQVNVNTHDATNNTKYYRWEYIETFLIHPKFASPLKHFSHPDTILARPVVDQIDTCWQSDTSSNITLATSAKLSQDIIASQPLTKVSATSDKIGYMYSILVKQYALTPGAYNYMQLLKKNTQDIGTIFDPQPANFTGNIHCIANPKEPVIGFVTCGGYTQKRIFVSKKNLPAWTPLDKYGYCQIDTAYFINPQSNGRDVEEYLYTDFKIPMYTVYFAPDTPKIIGYGAVYRECADCTVRGTNKKPSYWP